MVTVPSVEHEQLRDVVRCREDIRGDLMRARHRLGKFLLRREIYYEGPAEAWSRRHRAWLASLRFADRASQLTLADYLHAQTCSWPAARGSKPSSSSSQATRRGR